MCRRNQRRPRQPSSRHSRLDVGQQQLAPFIHTAPGRVVLALPGQDVDFVRGAISPPQIGQHRASYINAILIQSRGRAEPQACTQCRAPRPGLRPFPVCHRLAGHFGGACANCKWRDHGARCSFVRRPGNDGDGADGGDDERRSRSPAAEDRTQGRLGGPRLGERRMLGAGTQQDPLVL